MSTTQIRELLSEDAYARLSEERMIAWLFVAPAIVLPLAVAIYPFLQMIHDSFFIFSGAGQRESFVGVENFVTVLTDGRFIHATLFTVVFVAIVVIDLVFRLRPRRRRTDHPSGARAEPHRGRYLPRTRTRSRGVNFFDAGGDQIHTGGDPIDA